jgi:hypothetical protein
MMAKLVLRSNGSLFAVAKKNGEGALAPLRKYSA